MSIVATMLSGNSEQIAADAVCSVIDWVDLFLLIDTGITDQTAEIVAKTAGEKLRTVEFAWCQDFAEARDFSLQQAALHGGKWALTVDTDERLSFSGFASPNELHAKLDSERDVLLWNVSDESQFYTKERFIRVPSPLRWQGRTHEALVGATAAQQCVLAGATFCELPKTPEQMRNKLQRDLAVLQEETRDKPENPRWWYYLGQTLEDLKDPLQAVEAYRRCAALDGWAEQSAWACFKGASCLCETHQFQAAIDMAAQGLAKHAGSPELAWLASFCCYQSGRYEEAVYWAHMSIALGHVEGAQAGASRISFRYLPGWYEAPYDVLRFSYQKLGQVRKEQEATAKYERALLQNPSSNSTTESIAKSSGPSRQV